MWFLLLLLIILVLLVLVRIKKRKYFWKAKDGTKLSFKEFMKRWGSGIEGITPLQQTKTTLWSYPLVLGGILTGLIIMLLRKEFWLVLILGGSLPMTLMGLLSTWQKYKQQTKIQEVMDKLNKKNKKRK